MIQILRHYEEHYVPKHEDGSYITTVLFGDALSCERATHAQLNRLNEQGCNQNAFVLSPAEWHLRMHILEDIYAELWNDQGLRDIGTLVQLRNDLNHTNVSEDVAHHFAHDSDFMDTVTSAYVVMAAMHFLGLENTKDQPGNVCGDLIDIMNDTAQKVVDHCFQPFSVSDIIDAPEYEEDGMQFCVCKEPAEGEMLGCSNDSCPQGLWFHPRCINMLPTDIPSHEWYCCPDCERTSLAVGGGASSQRRSRNKTTNLSSGLMDHKNEYSRAVVMRGLFHMALRDAVRENDGERMLIHWKFLMPHFFHRGHPKYFILALRLLLQTAGAASPRLAFQLKWARTVNAKGGAGHNLEADLQMEHFNRDYKGMFHKIFAVRTSQ